MMDSFIHLFFSCAECQSACREVKGLWYVVLRGGTKFNECAFCTDEANVSLPFLQCPTWFWVPATTQPGRTPRSLPSPQTLRQDVQSE